MLTRFFRKNASAAAQVFPNAISDLKMAKENSSNPTTKGLPILQPLPIDIQSIIKAYVALDIIQDNGSSYTAKLWRTLHELLCISGLQVMTCDYKLGMESKYLTKYVGKNASRCCCLMCCRVPYQSIPTGICLTAGIAGSLVTLPADGYKLFSRCVNRAEIDQTEHFFLGKSAPPHQKMS